MLLSAAGFRAIAASAAGGAERPNILFIVADDQGAWALGASGKSQAFTPNMDRIAREGARFTHAFAPTPVCSPARASMLTSRYGTELGIMDWINVQADRGLGLDERHLTWPRLLRDAGYATALFGKWHLGELAEQHPTRRGYETFVGFRGGSASPRDPVLEKNGRPGRESGFIVDLVTDEAIAWLSQTNRSRPFAVSLHYREPHALYLPVPEEDWARVETLEVQVPNPDLPGLDQERVRKLTREYLASVAALDRNIGKLLAALEKLNLATNTVVIYTSDHGYNLGHHGLLYKGNAQWMLTREFLPAGTRNVPAGQRPNLFDTSLNVPLVIRWPGKIPAGSVNTNLISHLDWLPTFASMAGIRIPAGTNVRGRDASGVLRGMVADKNWNAESYYEYSMHHGAQVHLRAIRTPEWKLIRDFKNEGRDELYQLSVDPDETRNLIESRDKDSALRLVYSRLNSRLLSRMKEIKDPALQKPAVPGAAAPTLKRKVAPKAPGKGRG